MKRLPRASHAPFLAILVLLGTPSCGPRPVDLPDFAWLQDAAADTAVPADLPGPDHPADRGEPSDPAEPADDAEDAPTVADASAPDPAPADLPAAPDPGPADAAADAAPGDPGPTDLAAPDAGPPGVVAPVVDGQYRTELAALIAGAASSIDLAHFEFNRDATVDQVRDALSAAVGRGVAVRVLLDAEIDDNPPRVAELSALGIDAKLGAASPTLHVKLVVVDGATALMGSTNLSGASMKSNHETNLRLEGGPAPAFLQRYFDAVWAAPSSFASPAPVATAALEVFGDRAYFPNVHPLLASAQERVWVLMYGMVWSDPYADGEPARLVDAVIAAAARGVDVRVVLEHSDWNPDMNATNLPAAERLAAAGVDVRWDLDTRVSHAKLVLVDDAAVVSTCNWSYSGLALQHEAGAITTDGPAVEALATYFQQVRDESRPVAP